ncbi:MAG: bifunctional hydroxymethylpyrimidine kinase/phosphomethylpyrimidine kinase [Coriobacteriales bacterium]
MKKVLSIAGSDCSGGAGIQADLKTFSAHGVFGMTAIVSVVAENTARVIDIQNMPPKMIEEQIDAVYEDIVPDAVKVGMLSAAPQMEAVAGKIREHACANVVIDPVMFAKNGDALMDPGSIDTLVRTVLPLADVLTPNIPEARNIAGFDIKTVEDMERAARAIARMGCRNVLVKGGNHIPNAVDVLFDGTEFHHFKTRYIETTSTHGTGCTYSSAIASNLALGLGVTEAVEAAKNYVTTAIEHAPNIGHGCGAVHHFYDLYRHGLPAAAREA